MTGMVVPVELVDRYRDDPRVQVLIDAMGWHQLVAISTLAKLDEVDTRPPRTVEVVPPALAAAVHRVTAAWTNEGRMPEFHRVVQADLGRRWPTLRNAVVALVQVAR